MLKNIHDKEYHWSRISMIKNINAKKYQCSRISQITVLFFSKKIEYENVKKFKDLKYHWPKISAESHGFIKNTEDKNKGVYDVKKNLDIR